MSPENRAGTDTIKFKNPTKKFFPGIPPLVTPPGMVLYLYLSLPVSAPGTISKCESPGSQLLRTPPNPIPNGQTHSDHSSPRDAPQYRFYWGYESSGASDRSHNSGASYGYGLDTESTPDPPLVNKLVNRLMAHPNTTRQTKTTRNQLRGLLLPSKRKLAQITRKAHFWLRFYIIT